jgi:O-antigen ligase
MRPVDEWGKVVARATGSERLYDGIALVLLMWPATAGMWLLGSTRTWGYAPGLVISLLGSLLVLARPLVFRETPCWRIPPGFWIFAVLAVYVAVGVPWASVPYAARWEALRWVCLLAAAFAWTQLGGRAHRWKWLLGVLLMAAALDSLYALIQEVNGSGRVLWEARPEQYGMRASGTYLCPNHFADFVAMLFPLALVLIFLPEAGFPLRLMAIYFLAVSTPVLYWTQSRSGWLGLLGGLGVTWLLLAWRKGRVWLLLALVTLPGLAAALGWTAWKTLPAVRERFELVLADPDKASGIRLQMWRDAPAMFRDRPVFGFGGGSFVWAYPPYQRHVKEHLTWDFAHNEFIQMLLEYGAVGLALALVGLLACAWGLSRGVLRARSRAGALLLAGAGGGLASSLIHACFDFNFHIFPNPHALVWIGGVAWSVWFVQEQGDEAVEGRCRRLRRAGAAVGAAVCGVCAWFALSGGISYVWNLKAEIARAQMDLDKAAGDYQKSIRWDGGNWQPHLGLGNLRSIQALWFRDPDPAAEQAGKLQLAEVAAGHFRRAEELNACDMAVVFGLARVDIAKGDREAALEKFRQAATYQRRHVFYREQLGIQLRQMGREREALEVFRQNAKDGVATDVGALNIRALERKQAKEAAAVPAP